MAKERVVLEKVFDFDPANHVTYEDIYGPAKSMEDLGLDINDPNISLPPDEMEAFENEEYGTESDDLIFDDQGNVIKRVIRIVLFPEEIYGDDYSEPCEKLISLFKTK